MSEEIGPEETAIMADIEESVWWEFVAATVERDGCVSAVAVS